MKVLRTQFNKPGLDAEAPAPAGEWTALSAVVAAPLSPLPGRVNGRGVAEVGLYGCSANEPELLERAREWPPKKMLDSSSLPLRLRFLRIRAPSRDAVHGVPGLDASPPCAETDCGGGGGGGESGEENAVGVVEGFIVANRRCGRGS